MQRLIDDANRIGEANGEAADLSIESFSDIVTAIQRIQEEQGIAGTTSKEAATTIEGSFNTTKAAWENLVAGFANPDADLDQLMDNLIVAVVGDKEGEGLLNNLIPAVERALQGIGQFIVKAAPVIAERLPALMEAILPSLLSAATSLVAGLVQALPTILQILIDQAPMIMSTIAQALLDVAPLLLDMVAQIFVLLVDAAGAGIEFLWNAAMELIAPMIEAINNAFASIGDFLANLWDGIKTTLENAWTAIGNAVTSAWNAITTTISNVLNGIKTTVSNIWDGIKTTISNVLNAIKTTVSNVWNNIKTTISNVVNGIKTTVSNVWNAIKTTISNVINGIKTTVTNVWNNIKTSITDTVENIRSGVAEKFQAVYDKAKEIFENVKSAITNPVESAKEFVKNLVDDIKGFFDFDWHLPDLKLPHIVVGSYINVPVLGTIPDPTTLRVEWYKKAYDNPWMFTKPTVMGFGDGNGGEMVYGHDNLMRDIKEAVGTQPRAFAPVINVYTQEGQSNEEIAHRVMDILTFEYQRQGSVFA